MTFASNGYLMMFGSLALLVLVFAAALRLRSWPLWLAGVALTVASIAVFWVFRIPSNRAVVSYRAALPLLSRVA